VADGVEVRVRGLNELAAGVGRLARNVDRDAGDEFGRMSARMADQVRGRVPVDTGALAGSVQGGPRGRGGRLQMGDGVPYARFVEFGGRGFPRSTDGNYVGPVVTAAAGELVDAGNRAAGAAIAGTSWPTP
jgi:hypothetical protein